MIVILEGIGGNVNSVKRMIQKSCNKAVKISNKQSDIEASNVIILAGVGHFDFVMKKINDLECFQLIKKKVLNEEINFLGICAGMQVLLDRSEEGTQNGLGWIEGEVKKFNDFDSGGNALRVPHIGWNSINRLNDSKLINKKMADERFYFVHSYYVDCLDRKHVIATTDYGKKFDSIISKKNICGVQFHPEKSHIFGLKFFENYFSAI